MTTVHTNTQSASHKPAAASACSSAHSFYSVLRGAAQLLASSPSIVPRQSSAGRSAPSFSRQLDSDLSRSMDFGDRQRLQTQLGVTTSATSCRARFSRYGTQPAAGAGSRMHRNEEERGWGQGALVRTAVCQPVLRRSKGGHRQDHRFTSSKRAPPIRPFQDGVPPHSKGSAPAGRPTPEDRSERCLLLCPNSSPPPEISAVHMARAATSVQVPAFWLSQCSSSVHQDSTPNCDIVTIFGHSPGYLSRRFTGDGTNSPRGSAALSHAPTQSC